MKNTRTILIIITLLICLFGLFGCKKKNTSNGDERKQFGKFGYNSHILIDQAVADINSSQAKSIAENNYRNAKTNVSNASFNGSLERLSVSTFDVDSTTPDDLVDAIMTKYAKCTITTTYCETGKDDLQKKEDLLQGTDFKNMVQKNTFASYSQLLAKNLIVFPNLIDEMEKANEEFKKSDVSKISPFKNIFTYHKDNSDNLIIQIHDFAEIPSSVGGGIGCSYLQDTEIVYDSEGKIVTWMTSLGLYSATPTGTIQQGYILYMNFDWALKE